MEQYGVHSELGQDGYVSCTIRPTGVASYKAGNLVAYKAGHLAAYKATHPSIWVRQ